MINNDAIYKLIQVEGDNVLPLLLTITNETKNLKLTRSFDKEGVLDVLTKLNALALRNNCPAIYKETNSLEDDMNERFKNNLLKGKR